MEEKNMDLELRAEEECPKFSRIKGALLKAGFFALVGLMGCGTLGIIIFTFIGRGFIG
ncbi:MAG: hypothetical protein IJY86_02780 [Clostridia bacterium]|nr:hypothetical protein [Clostridia bacterium]